MICGLQKACRTQLPCRLPPISHRPTEVVASVPLPGTSFQHTQAIIQAEAKRGNQGMDWKPGPAQTLGVLEEESEARRVDAKVESWMLGLGTTGLAVTLALRDAEVAVAVAVAGISSHGAGPRRCELRA